MQLSRGISNLVLFYTCVWTSQAVPLGRTLSEHESHMDVTGVNEVESILASSSEIPQQHTANNASQGLQRLLNILTAKQASVKMLSQQLDQSSTFLDMIKDVLDNVDDVKSDSKEVDVIGDTEKENIQTISIKNWLSRIIMKSVGESNRQESDTRLRRSASDQDSQSLRDFFDDVDDLDYDDSEVDSESAEVASNRDLNQAVERHLTHFLADMLKVFEYDLKTIAQNPRRPKPARKHRGRRYRPEARPKRSIRSMFHSDPTVREILLKYLRMKGSDRSGKHQLRYG